MAGDPTSGWRGHSARAAVEAVWALGRLVAPWLQGFGSISSGAAGHSDGIVKTRRLCWIQPKGFQFFATSMQSSDRIEVSALFHSPYHEPPDC